MEGAITCKMDKKCISQELREEIVQAVFCTRRRLKDLNLDNDNFKGVEKSKYLGLILNKQRISKYETQERIYKRRTVTGKLSSLLWNKKVMKRTSKMQIIKYGKTL